MKLFSNIIGILCFVLGTIAMDPSEVEDERKESMTSLLKKLCDNHQLEPQFIDDYYNKMFYAIMLKHQNVTDEVSETTFKERLEYIYKVANRQNEVEPRCLHDCIKNETSYITCMKINIFVTMLSHSVHCDSHRMHDDSGIHAIFAEIYYGQQINLKESDWLEANKFVSIDTPNTIPHEKSFIGVDFESSNPRKIHESTLLENERNIRVQRRIEDESPQPLSSLMKGSSSSDDIISDNLDENSISSGIFSSANSGKPDKVPSSITLITAANFENNPNAPELEISNISPSINIVGENSRHEYPKSDSRELRSIEKKGSDVSPLENEQVEKFSTSQVPELNPILLKNETKNMSFDDTEERKEKIVKNGETVAENVTDKERQKKELNDMDNILVKNVTEEKILKDINSKAENVTFNLTSLLHEGMKAKDQESNLTELESTGIKIASRDKGNSTKVIVKEPTDGNKTDPNNENSIILNKDVKAVDNMKLNLNNGSTSCTGSCTDQKETFESAMNVPNTSSRLVFGITALLVVLGLAAGAITIYYFVLDNHLPCSLRPRSNFNVNQPPQSRG